MGFLEQAIGEFGRHMKIERNLSEHTREGYLTDLKQFQTFWRRWRFPAGWKRRFPSIRW